jgi:YHS domain-containing protein
MSMKGEAMTGRSGKFGLVAVSVIAAASFALAHDPATKATGMREMECGKHHSAAMKASDEVSIHLADAKRSTTLAAMRSHVEAADRAMTEMKNQMSACMEMMEKSHGGMMGEGKEMMGSGMMSGKTSTPTAAAKAVDPVCGMEVETANAPKTTYAGKTYYFCSEEDKAKFLKDPARYAGKKS